MILLCNLRHREKPIALDRHTLRIWPIDRRRGTHGGCEFWIDRCALTPGPRCLEQDWFLVAREIAPHVYEPMTAEQQAVAARLAELVR